MLQNLSDGEKPFYENVKRFFIVRVLKDGRKSSYRWPNDGEKSISAKSLVEIAEYEQFLECGFAHQLDPMAGRHLRCGAGQCEESDCVVGDGLEELGEIIYEEVFSAINGFVVSYKLFHHFLLHLRVMLVAI